MLGGVPMSVTSPPRMVPNDSGIRMTAGDRLALIADCTATGISSDSAPTLFMIADNGAPIPIRVPICVAGVRVPGVRRSARRSTAPEFSRARLMISTPITVIVAGWPKPRKASPDGTTPTRTAAIRAAKATTS